MAFCGANVCFWPILLKNYSGKEALVLWRSMCRLGFPPLAPLAPEERIFITFLTQPVALGVADALLASLVCEGFARLRPA